MIYSTISVLFASLASPAANAFTSSPVLYGLKTHKPSVSLSDADKDIGIRFEKFPLIEGAEERGISPSPLTAESKSPLKAEDAKWLKQNTEADSVTIDKDLPNTTDIDQYVKDFQPLYPGQKGFWKEFRKVIDVRKERIKDKNSGLNQPLEKNVVYKWPNLWLDRTESELYPWKDKSNRNLNLDDVAQSVQGEFSNYHQQDAITRAIANMVKGKRGEFLDLGQFDDEDVIPKRDFIAFQVRAARINAWSLDVVARTNFYLKWFHRVPRPEEVAWKIEEGDLGKEQGVPQDVIKLIKDLKLTSAADFTAYENGCPNHPSFPAMHSAGSTCSTWFPALYNIDPNDYKQLLRMDYAVAFARTVAGVHYPQDNLAGLNIGQRIVREKLPGFLAKEYGYDADKVKERLEDLKFDWNEDYNNNAGKICGVAAHKFLETANENLRKRNEN